MAENQKPTDLTARLVAQPSKIIPGIPAFVFSVPAGWVVDEAPNALAVIRQPAEVDGFWVNAILSHDRVSRQVDFKAAARITWAKLQREAPDAKESFERMARFGANIMYLRGAEMTSPSTKRPIAQLHSLFFAPVADKGKTVDFFQIIGTAPTTSIQQFGSDFMEIIGSFRFL